jgi:hypothetical protein
MYNYAAAWEDSRVWGIGDRDYTRRQFSVRLVARIAPNQKHGAATEAVSCRGAETPRFSASHVETADRRR